MSFWAAFRAEGIKFRRSPVFLAFPVLTLLAAGLGTFNYVGNLEVLKEGWYDLWSQHTLFACMLFVPAELGVFCAWQWRLEHTDYCWNRLMTAPLPFGTLYLAKLLWACLVSAGAAAVTGLCYFVCGLAVGLPAADFPPMAPEWLLCGTAGCVVICAWQELLAMRIRVFAVPVAIALLGGVSGLLLMAKGYGWWWPWAYLDLGMRANHPQAALALVPFFGLALGMTLLPTGVAVAVTAKSDIHAE